MKPVDQDVFGAPDGNCFTACIASIIEQPLDALRDVETIYREGAKRHISGDDKAWTAAWETVVMRLAQRFGVVPAVVLVRQGGFAPQGYSLMAGKSPRGEFGHYVVALDGKLVHDPHPDRTGLDGPIEDYTVLVRITEGVPRLLEVGI